MGIFLEIIKGILMGIANIIPGVSGGTMAVSLGVFDQMIFAISHLFSNFKKSLRILLPLLIGMGIGIVGFTYIIEYLLKNQTLPTCLTFIGLILGGLPVLINKCSLSIRKQNKKLSLVNILLFIVFFIFVIALSVLNASEDGLTTFSVDAITLVKMFFVGVIAAATMVIPGVSGSLILMVLGYYYGILSTIREFIDALKSFNTTILFEKTLILAPFGIGVVLGIFLISKLIEYLFKRHSVSTYCAILGLIIASPIAIIINTGALSANNFSIIGLIIGIILALIGAFITWVLGRLE
jgi:putative membrane protein